jgi:hypothetical protein
MSWLATPTRRFWPPEMPLRMGVPMRVSACSVRPKASSKPLMRRRRSFLGSELVLERREAKCRVSRTVRDPMRASSCSTKQLISRKVDREALVPLTRMVPSALAAPVSREASMLRSVVLPQPEGPMSARISPIVFGGTRAMGFSFGTRRLHDSSLFFFSLWPSRPLFIRRNWARYVPASTNPSTLSTMFLSSFVSRSLTVTVTPLKVNVLTVRFMRWASATACCSTSTWDFALLRASMPMSSPEEDRDETLAASAIVLSGGVELDLTL